MITCLFESCFKKNKTNNFKGELNYSSLLLWLLCSGLCQACHGNLGYDLIICIALTCVMCPYLQPGG